MKVDVQKITHETLMQTGIEFSMKNTIESNLSLEKIYQCKHSPIRTQLFVVRLYGIPYEVAVHLRTHAAVGQLWIIGSERADRNTGKRDGNTDVFALLNAQHLIEMSWKRLCFQSYTDTTRVMLKIKDAVKEIDPALAEHMVPHCLYINRCDELKSCRYYNRLPGGE